MSSTAPLKPVEKTWAGRTKAGAPLQFAYHSLQAAPGDGDVVPGEELFRAHPLGSLFRNADGQIWVRGELAWEEWFAVYGPGTLQVRDPVVGEAVVHTLEPTPVWKGQEADSKARNRRNRKRQREEEKEGAGGRERKRKVEETGEGLGRGKAPAGEEKGDAKVRRALTDSSDIPQAVPQLRIPISPLSVPSPACDDNKWMQALFRDWMSSFPDDPPSKQAGLDILTALLAYPTKLETFEHTLDSSIIVKGEHPTLEHVMTDLIQAARKNGRKMEAVDNAHGGAEDEALSDILASLMQHDRGYEEPPRLLSVLAIPLGDGGIESSDLCLPPDWEKHTYVKRIKAGLINAISIVVPGGGVTLLHGDGKGASSIVIHALDCIKLWIFIPPTPDNLRLYAKQHGIAGTREQLPRLLPRLQGVRVFHVKGDSTMKALHIPPYWLHAVLTFRLSAHTGYYFHDVRAFEAAQAPIEWELGWVRKTLAAGLDKRALNELRLMVEDYAFWKLCDLPPDSKEKAEAMETVLKREFAAAKKKLKAAGGK